MAKKILIIEDEQTLVKALATTLQEEGFEVGVANDGQKGWEEMTQNKPDLILLDLILPKMDGFAVLAKMKQSEDLKDVPVLVVTNLSDVTDKVKSLGAEECLVKSDESVENIIDKVRKNLK